MSGGRRLARPQGLKEIFAWPTALAVVSTVGLIAALLWDDARDLAACIAIGAPVAAIAWALRFRRIRG